jgi:acyl transferase domain-containing protein/acyl carrier protein
VDSGRSPAEIRDWLLTEVAARVGIEPRRIDPAERFSRYGLDSMKAAGVTAALAAYLGRTLPRTLLWDHPSIDGVVRHLTAAPAPAPPADRRPGPRADEPIAIVGLACRFPEAPDAAAYWRLLIDGIDAIREVPPDRWDLERYFSPDAAAPGRMSTRWGGFVADVDKFDPQFFGISPREAAQMDPQQRLVLELAWEALEDAGIHVPSLKNTSAGVYVGAMWSDYARLIAGCPAAITPHTATGQDTSIIPARVSYTFGLQGPSLAINTACSSSLVAVHTACQALRSGEATLAIAGGVNLVLSPDSTVAMSKFGGMAPDGRSKAFDARANGYVRGEGAGLVVLKPLSQAVKDGDSIYCVIVAEGINNDGFSNGLTAPNPQAQEEMLRLAYERAGIAPSDVDYIETHGTGTLLGDPIEAGAIGRVLGVHREPDRPLALGSVKTNIGHLEGAAGIAGLIKVALAMRHGIIPGNLHFESPNPNIDFEGLHLTVQTKATAWPRTDRPATAGVSSFGFGGTNCHIVLQGRPRSTAELLALSADSEDALRTLVTRMRDLAAGGSAPAGFAAVCRAASEHLSAGPWRAAVTARSTEDLAAQLQLLLDRGEGPGIAALSSLVRRPQLVWVLSAHGGQWAGMGRQLFEREPAFRHALRRCALAIQREAGWDLIDELLADESRSSLDRMEVAQPAIFAIQVALAALWRSFGLEPDAVVGHSMGEVAAAHIAGALGLDDAVKVICQRSRLLAKTAGKGALAVVGLSAEGTAAALKGRGDRLWIVAFNSPASTLVSGEPDALAALLADLERDGVFCRKVRVDVAPHSPHTDPLLDELAASVANIRPRVGSVPVFSTVTGTVVAGTDFDASYWVRNLRQPVLFAQAIDGALAAGPTTFLELGPHPVLAPAVAQSLALSGGGHVLESMRRGEDERAAMLDAIGKLYVLGHSPAWDAILSGAEPLELPGEIVRTGGSQVAVAGPYPLALSSHTRDTLIERAKGIAGFVRRSPAVLLRDICYTASARRVAHPHRFATVAATPRELVEILDAFAGGELRPGTSIGERDIAGPGRIAFVFPGQGSQWLGMGRQLMRREPVFRAAIERCERAIAAETGWSVIEELTTDASRARFDRIDVVQPALFAVQVALTDLWRSWGVEPEAVVGHSMGEVAASHVAGVLSLEDAARVICRRSHLLRRISGKGSMAVVELSRDEAAGALEGFEDRVSVAVSNSPRSTVLSGDPAAVAEIMERLTARGVFCKHVKVDVASHSPQVDPLREDLLAALDGIEPRAGSLPVYSTVLGAPTDGRGFDATYWCRNLREPVLFSAALSHLIADGHDTFVEASSHPLLVTAVQESLRNERRAGIAIGSLRRDEDEQAAMLSSAGALFAFGHNIEFERLFADGGRLVGLPPFAWQRERCWLEMPDAPAGPTAREAGIDGCFHEVEWIQQSCAGSGSSGTRRWLVLADDGGMATALAAALKRAGDRVDYVGRQADGAEIELDDSSWDGVVDLRALDTRTHMDADHEAVANAVDACVLPALRLVQVLGQRGGVRAPRLYLVTSGAQSVAGDAVRAPGQAALWGLGSTVAVEHPELHCTRVDLEDGSADRAVEAFAEELRAGAPEDLVAFRRGIRYVARLGRGVDAIRASDAIRELAAIAARPGGGVAPRLLRALGGPGGADGVSLQLEAPALPDFSRGTSVITGGLGGLGLATAAWLVEQGARHIALLGRSAPSEAGAAAIEKMRGAGAEVVTMRVDVASEPALTGALAAIDGTMPAVRGVVHAAGVLDDAVLMTLDTARVRAVLGPKVRGAWLLHRLTRDRELDYFVLYSSVLSYLGAAGQANHAAANAFMDALAHYRRGLGLTASSVNWGVWSEVGSAAQSGRGDRLAAMGLSSITPAEGCAALERLLVADAVQASVMRFDALAWCRHLPGAAHSTLFAALVPAVGAAPAAGHAAEPPIADRLRALASGAERQQLMETYLAAQVARVLRLAVGQIDLNKALRGMGLDSLMAVEFRNRLEADTGVSIPTTLVWNYPTVVKLAPEVAARMGIELGDGPDAADGSAAMDALGGDSTADLEALLGALETLPDDEARQALTHGAGRGTDV